MPSFTAITTIFTYLVLGFGALAPIVEAGPSPSLTTRSGEFTNPQGIVARSPVPHLYPQTNAERFRRGLGPAPPKRRYARSRLQARQSASASAIPCPKVTGVIAVTMDGGNGYISKSANTFGEFSYTTSLDSALHVSFCSTDVNPHSIVPLNGGSAAHHFLGLFKGYASSSPDIGSGSSNYLYLGGTDHTGAHAIPANGGNTFTDATGQAESIESSVWNLGAGNTLTLSWVNSDGSVPTSQIVYVPSAGAFAVTGDLDKFRANFGNAPVVALSFVADS